MSGATSPRRVTLETVDFTTTTKARARTQLAKATQDPSVSVIEVIHLPGESLHVDLVPFTRETQEDLGGRMITRYIRT